ncbi:MAG: serine/threonine protein kinase [Polyangiaceae bacterium]|nr:serine/threonine protein kinase [Polyangiaceae bacterium]
MLPGPSSWVVPDAGPPADHNLGGYELLIPVAHGGMGTVWAARPWGARGAARLVAVKTMLPRLAEDPHFQRMFRVEAEIASRIRHPNACHILELREEPGRGLSLVMEWVEGSSLQTLLDACRARKGRVPWGVAARIGAQAAMGLHAAHELRDDRGARIGVVHRDVSPHNLLVSSRGAVKIIDFGIAKAVERTDNPTTVSGQIKGKVRYLAPEQARAESIDHRADIFSLGIVLYQLVTGAHPFDAGHDLATMRRIVVAEPAATPAEAVPGCPPALSAVIMRALAKERDDRFASMAELAGALSAIAEELRVGDGEVVSFIQDAVGVRIAARAAKIEEAARIVDEEAARAAEGPARVLGGAARAPVGAARAAGGAAPRLAPRRALRAAALCGIGAALGAAAIAWLAPPWSPGDPGARTLESAGLAAPPVAALVAQGSGAQGAPPGARSGAPSVDPPAEEAPKGQATGAAGPAPSRDERRARFRKPGF